MGNQMAARKVVPRAAQLADQWVAWSVLLKADVKESSWVAPLVFAWVAS